MCQEEQRSNYLCGHTSTHPTKCKKKTDMTFSNRFRKPCLGVKKSKTTVYEICNDCRQFWKSRGYTNLVPEVEMLYRVYRDGHKYYGGLTALDNRRGQMPVLMRDEENFQQEDDPWAGNLAKWHDKKKAQEQQELQRRESQREAQRQRRGSDSSTITLWPTDARLVERKRKSRGGDLPYPDDFEPEEHEEPMMSGALPADMSHFADRGRNPHLRAKPEIDKHRYDVESDYGDNTDISSQQGDPWAKDGDSDRLNHHQHEISRGAGLPVPNEYDDGIIDLYAGSVSPPKQGRFKSTELTSHPQHDKSKAAGGSAARSEYETMYGESRPSPPERYGFESTKLTTHRPERPSDRMNGHIPPPQPAMVKGQQHDRMPRMYGDADADTLSSAAMMNRIAPSQPPQNAHQPSTQNYSNYDGDDDGDPTRRHRSSGRQPHHNDSSALSTVSSYKGMPWRNQIGSSDSEGEAKGFQSAGVRGLYAPK